MNKEEQELDVCVHNSQMTLKPSKKIRRKNKYTNLQELYDEGKVTSQEFYINLIKFIKSRLMQDLIRRGYYINGIRQVTFTRDEWDGCYTHVLHKIIHEYSKEKGTLATYVRWQIRGWGQLITQKQRRQKKYMPKGTVSLDKTNLYNIRLEEYEDGCDLMEYIEEDMDHYYFGDTILTSITEEDVSSIRDKVNNFKSHREGFEWLD